MLDNVFTFETNSSFKKNRLFFQIPQAVKAIFFKQQEGSFVLFYLTASYENTSLSKEKASLTPYGID